MATRDDILGWRGQTLVDSDGDKIGSIEEIYLDAAPGRSCRGSYPSLSSGIRHCPRSDGCPRPSLQPDIVRFVSTVVLSRT